ncbi:MAG: sporulation initiation factor Spo0A C-terminal domain-containing protein [Oscillibacter sp.]|nr:sporulation initiation factor Spo0A C-terminal domain-containing protein [Oscillibacter sp.]MEA4992215.1 sporulation initiation factor Spo0A C-terminal domain-containing protein [Oscillibacter sp.]
MNRKIYRQLAKKHGVTTEEIRRDMQSALNAAYENPARTPETVRAQSTVLRGDEVPTPEEFIRHAVREVRRRTETD